MKEPVDLPGQFAIFSLMSARFAMAPIVVATDTHLQHPAHGTHWIQLRMLLNKGITQLWLREKMASAFFIVDLKIK